MTENNHFKWNTPYLKTNRKTAEILTADYTPENSIYVQNKSVRGYANLLFGRGIYEWVHLNNAIPIAITKNKRYIVEFNITTGPWNMYDYNNYFVYDMDNPVINTLNLTDGNWEKGVSSFGNVLLFGGNIPQNKEQFITNTPETISVETDNGTYAAKIVSVEEKGEHIHVTIENGADKNKFQYPAVITIIDGE